MDQRLVWTKSTGIRCYIWDQAMDDLASEAGTSDLGWLLSIEQQRDVNAVPPLGLL